MTLIATAYAHGNHAENIANPFQLKWIWDPTLIFFLLLAVFYARGITSNRSSHLVKRWQVLLFFCGIAVLSVAYLPPVDTLSDQLFSAHMVQHLLITSVGVPLVIFGVPSLVILKGFPPSLKRKVAVPFLKSSFLKNFLKLVHRPLPALLLYEGTLWLWHIPKFYDLALLNDAIHLLEHSCMAYAAMNFWPFIIDPKPMRSPLNYPVRILMLLLVMTLDMALSAALTYSGKVWYAYERIPMPSWWKWNHLQDQQLGGLIMWVPGGVIWLIALITIFSLWMRNEQALDLAAA
jgi:putative membrane protein